MHLVSINVGRPTEYNWQDRVYRTAIYKTPVSGSVAVTADGVAGDLQANQEVHGGPDKRVYLYPFEHYARWRSVLDGAEFGWGAFGENLTTAGLLESDLRIGDRLGTGSAVFEVSQPRRPCNNLNLRFRRPDMVQRFTRSGTSGAYLRLVQAGTITVGDPIHFVERTTHEWTVQAIYIQYLENKDFEGMARAAALPALAESWRRMLQTRLEARTS